jgi:hypothetical protein
MNTGRSEGRKRKNIRINKNEKQTKKQTQLLLKTTMLETAAVIISRTEDSPTAIREITKPCE